MARPRLNTEKYEQFCSVLFQYMKERNYPDKIIKDAIAKASVLTQSEALKPTYKSDKDIIPFVCTYNPSLPNIGEIINKYWGILKCSESSTVQELFKYKPIVAFKRPTNLKDILVHSKLNQNFDKNGCVTKCKRSRCSHCSSIVVTNKFSSTTMSTEYDVKHQLNCSSNGVIYLITCKKCKKQYVGQTQQKCSIRMNSHRFDIKHNNYTNVAEHFNLSDHSLQDFSFMPIDQVHNVWRRLLKETEWIYRLGTISPFGMNAKVLY